MAHGRTRGSFDRSRRGAGRVALAAFVFLWSRSAFALDPSLDVSQYAHTAWRIRDGFTRGEINAIAQTPDGYLWLGTEFGLVRFDGVRAVPWQPAGELPSNVVSSLLVAHDGTLWIGTLKGLASWKRGKLTRYPELAGHFVLALVQDRDGTVWAGAVVPGRLCAIQADKVQCQGQGSFGRGINALYEDHLGNLWLSASTGLWRWKPGPPDHYSYPAAMAESGTLDLIEDDSGALLLGSTDGVKRLAGGRIESDPSPALDTVSKPHRFLRSRDGSLWIATLYGLAHVHQGKTDVFAVADGLSGEAVRRMYEDREGNIWVSTSGGLDRFREYAFPTISANQGLSSSNTWSVQATRDGSIWIATSDGLNRWRDGQVDFYGKQPGSPRSRRSGVTRSTAAPALETAARSLGMDEQGRLWAAMKDEMVYLEANRFVRARGLPGGNVWSIAPDGRGNTWVSVGFAGLFHRTAGDAVQEFPWSQFGKTMGATALLPDPSRGGVWLSFYDGGVGYFKDGRVIASYTAADGLGSGPVIDLRLGDEGTVWAATERGLSRIHDGHVLTLTAKNGLPCDGVHWSMEDDDHFVWLYMPCGLSRVARSELDAWVGDPGRTIQVTGFDASDGVRAVGAMGGYGPRVTKAPDGKIWFTTRDGVTVINPRHLLHNDVPPPVQIEQIVADGKVYDASAASGGRLRLPPGVSDLAIDYTALSLVVPEKVHFRVKLEGQDKDWREPINNRHAHYTNLAPKNYRFRVRASNNSGVWNEQGTLLDFTIAPAWYQTAWFRALGIAAALALIGAAYRIRIEVLRRRERSAQEARALQLANERLALALRGSNVGVWDFDLRSSSIADAPAHFVSLWEPARYHPDDLERVERAVDAYLTGKSPAFEIEWRLRHTDGSYRWWLNRGVAVRDAGGKPIRFLGSSVDINDRKTLEEELRHAKDAAESANRAKDQFIANVSHEIRTPMNAILGMTELALDASRSEEQRLSLSTVKSGAENLLVIIDDLLDFGKIEAGKLELAAEAFSLRQVLRECTRDLAVRAHRKGLELICDIAPDVSDDVVGDANRLRQVLLNLLGNAIKFTLRGEIVVRVDRAGREHRFSVRDTGIGIARDKQRTIFGAFEQADGSTARRYGGTGLGLTIAAQLVELMGGRIEVDSEPGRGSTFTFTVDFKAGDAPPVHPPTVQLEGMPVLVADDNASTREMLERWLRSWGMEPTLVSDGPGALAALRDARYPVAVIDAHLEGLGEMPATRVVLLGAVELPETLARFRELGGNAHVAKPIMSEELQAAIVVALDGRKPPVAQPPAPRPASRCLRILVAEDNDLNQLLMRQLLATRGHDVAIAADGREALARVESCTFDALLLDVHLPEVDGFEVIKTIRQREQDTGRHLHVVAVTARARQSDREACLAAGMDDFLAKPIAAAALWAALDRVADRPA